MDRIEKIKQFLAQSPGDSFLQHALALEYIKLGDDATAKGIFEQLLAENENYVGSYYHLAKLLERQGNTEAALETYQKGMQIARKVDDKHAYNELQAALEDLEED